ncbi:hypothetical protein KSP40_PGU018289 [Platanthera guangdongensis]|uniref:Uncharacterized protein n=1 Tax=Platanthera guangdongensis TaxID=2320717 RepID=A0ABR2LJQ7_9ASPA
MNGWGCGLQVGGGSTASVKETIHGMITCGQANLQRDAAIGVDPWCVSVDTAHRWIQAFSKNKQNLIQLPVNLVDVIWKGRPAAEIQPVTLQPLEFAGRTVAEKLKDLRERLAREKACGIVITALDEVSHPSLLAVLLSQSYYILLVVMLLVFWLHVCSMLKNIKVAWLYNIRGNDASYSPVVHAYAIVTTDLAFFYVDKRKVSSEPVASPPPPPTPPLPAPHSPPSSCKSSAAAPGFVAPSTQAAIGLKSPALVTPALWSGDFSGDVIGASRQSWQKLIEQKQCGSHKQRDAYKTSREGGLDAVKRRNGEMRSQTESTRSRERHD